MWHFFPIFPNPAFSADGPFSKPEPCLQTQVAEQMQVVETVENEPSDTSAQHHAPEANKEERTETISQPEVTEGTERGEQVDASVSQNVIGASEGVDAVRKPTWKRFSTNRYPLLAKRALISVLVMILLVYGPTVILFVRASLGDLDSQFNLGSAFELGHRLPQSDKWAFEWYTKSAQHGNGEAGYELARNYESGLGNTSKFGCSGVLVSAGEFKQFDKGSVRGRAAVQARARWRI